MEWNWKPINKPMFIQQLIFDKAIKNKAESIVLSINGAWKIGYLHYWSWNFNTLATWCKELTHLKRPWCWERLRAGGEGDDRRWYGWMVSLIQWTWVWVDSGSWWWTGRPGVLQFMELQRVRHDWATELNWIYKRIKLDPCISPLRKINLEWNEDLNVRLKTLKLLKENIGKMLLYMCFGNIFWIWLLKLKQENEK